MGFGSVVFSYGWRVGVSAGWVSGVERVSPTASLFPAFPRLAA